MARHRVSQQIWQDVLMGYADNPIAGESIAEMAKRGEIIVEGADGNDYLPVIFMDYGGGAETWTLKPMGAEPSEDPPPTSG